MKAQHEGTLTSPCIVWKNPQIPLTAPNVDCRLVNNSRESDVAFLHTRRGLTLLAQLFRDPAIGVRNGEEP